MGPGPRVGSSNQAAMSFDDLAVCLGRSGISPPSDTDCSVFNPAVFFEGFKDAVLALFCSVVLDDSFLAFLVWG